MKRLPHECRRRFAMLLAKVELHRLTRDQRDGGSVVIKHRSRLSKVLVPVGNLYLRLNGAECEVLSEPEWLRWETTVSPASEVANGSLIVVQCRGTPLNEILRDRDVSTDEKLTAVDFAMQALLQLHSRTVEFGEEAWPLSHGDATAENVCVDLKHESATWFDFDTRHRRELPAGDRHADDLRALLFSSAATLPADAFPSLANLRGDTGIPDEVRIAFRRRLHHDWRRPNTFHLAQAPLSYTAYQALTAQLMLALGRFIDYPTA